MPAQMVNPGPSSQQRHRQDRAGPRGPRAINPLITVMNLMSLMVATSVVKYSHNIGLRAGVAVGAVLIVVIAIVISKRRSTTLSTIEPGFSTESLSLNSYGMPEGQR